MTCRKPSEIGVHAVTGHTVNLTLDHDGVHATFTCHAPLDGWCRQTCWKGCEIWTPECLEHHPREVVDYCNPIEYVDNCGFWYENYIGAETRPRCGPVEFQWRPEVECYGWRYAKVAPS